MRKTDTEEIEVVSRVFEVKGFLDESSVSLYPHSKYSLLNFCYVIFDPLTNHISVLYYNYTPIW